MTYINGCELSETTPSVKNIPDQNIFFGPYNYIQLNGNIKNIQKNITIFMDIHQDLDSQTRCNSFDSIDISQYLYKLIKNTTEPLDFFLEIQHKNLQEPITDKRDIYILDVIEMFKTEFSSKGNSKSNPNVRLHYIDVRDHLKFNILINRLRKEVLPRLNLLKDNNLNNNDKINKLEEIKQHIEFIQKHIMDIFDKNINIKQNKLSNFENNSKEYYLNKIIHKYKHTSLKNNINDFYNAILLQYLEDFNGIFGTLLYILYSQDLNNLSKLFILYNKLNNKIFALYGLITDIYFLRRLLDKDYIKNVITYCGRNHALNYIYFLVKFCDFKIEKIYNSNGLSIEEFTNQIKSTDDLNKVHNLFLIEGEKPKQCIIKPNSNYLLGW